MSAPRRIRLALCIEYPLALRGGVSVLVEELIRRLGAGYEIILVSPDTREELDQHEVANRLFDHVQVPPEVNRRTSRALVNQLLDRNVEIAHFHLGGTYAWAVRFPGQSPISMLKDASVTVCSTVHWVLPLFEGYCGPAKPFWFKLALFPLCWFSKLLALRDLSVEIAVSKHDQSRLRRWFAPYRSRFRQFYHSRLTSAPSGLIERDAARAKIILNVGHIAPRKGQHFVADAFARIAAQYPEWELQLVGPLVDASYGRAIEEKAVKEGLAARVRLLGSRTDVDQLLRRAAIYVQPSLGEALGLALQEALAAGCACIGARSGGIPELIDDEQNGLLVNPADEAALATALTRLLSDEELRARLAAEAPKSIRARGMCAEKMIKQHVALYERLLDRRHEISST